MGTLDTYCGGKHNREFLLVPLAKDKQESTQKREGK